MVRVGKVRLSPPAANIIWLGRSAINCIALSFSRMGNLDAKQILGYALIV